MAKLSKPTSRTAPQSKAIPSRTKQPSTSPSSTSSSSSSSSSSSEEEKEEEIINFRPKNLKPTFHFQPSTLSSTLPSFLQAMKMENEKLASSGPGEEFEISDDSSSDEEGGDVEMGDVSEKKDGKKWKSGKEKRVYIEMELGLGVLEEKRARKKGRSDGEGVEIGGQDGSEEESESSESSEEDEDEEDSGSAGESSSESESEDDSPTTTNLPAGQRGGGEMEGIVRR